MSAGNRTVLAILDSRKSASRRSADHSVFAALDHFGVAWEVLDGADYMGFIPEYVAPRALYIIAHDGGANWLDPDVAEQIADAVLAGAGLVSFDRRVHQWPAPLRKLLPAGSGDETTRTGVLSFADESFISFGHDEGEQLELHQEIEIFTLPQEDGWRAIATDAENRAVIAAADAREGRLVVFGTGERLYDEAVYGHVRGIDGLVWRSLVRAAAKPFPMRCVPPYVTARMDDCNGAHSAFGYVDVMNRFGIRPNLGLFIDEMGPTDWNAVKRLYDSAGADFSMHAFRDDFYMARPEYEPWAVLPDKPDPSEGGTKTLFEGLSLDHNTGLDLAPDTIRENFARMDRAFADAGITHSRVLNAHFGEVGWRAVPEFLARGVDLPCNNSALGQLYSNQPVWRPRPYGIRGPTGRHGLIIDRCPQHPQMTFVSMSVSHLGTHMGLDILSGRVPFLDESEVPKLDEAAQTGIDNITLGLDALGFGVLFTHEERINVISPQDWDRVVEQIMRGLDGWDYECAGREHVGVICKRLLDSALVRANLTEHGLECELVGETGGPSPLTIWENDGEGCTRRVVDVDPIDDFAEITV
ncbi:MAG: hypothetical protein R6V19_01910 [Armatimonadota bacterium]